MRLQRSPHAGQAGFSLVELMVVIILIAIMTSLVLPEMKGTLEDALLRSTARKLVAACRLASSQAISFQQPHCVRINTKDGKYAVEPLWKTQQSSVVPTGRNSFTGASGDLDSRISLTFRTLDEIEPAEPNRRDTDRRNNDLPMAELVSAESIGREVLTFNTDGTAEGREIRLKDRLGVQLIVRINPVTSRVQIQEGVKE